MLCKNVPLTVQRFEHSAVSPELPGAVSSLNLLEALSLLKKYLIFLYDFQTIEYLISLFNSKAASKVPLIISIALMASPTTI